MQKIAKMLKIDQKIDIFLKIAKKSQPQFSGGTGQHMHTSVYTIVQLN